MKTFTQKALALIGAPLLFIKMATAQSGLPLPEFDKLKLDDHVNVELILADRYSVYSESDREINAKVENGVLRISSSAVGNSPIRVYTRSIVSVNMGGAAVLTCNDTLGNDLSVELDGTAKCRLLVSGASLSIKIDGASTLDVSGSAETVTADVDGAARLMAEHLHARKAIVETDGAASATIHVDSSLTAKSDGMSRISYLGDPPHKSMSLDGLSVIKSVNSGDVYDHKAIEGLAEDNPSDTTRFKLGKKKLLIIGDEDNKKEGHKRMKRVYAGFETGVSGFATPSLTSLSGDQKFLNPRIGNSWFFGFNLFEVNAHIIRNKLAFTTGLGMQWSNYRFDGDNYLAPNVDSLGYITSPDALSKNKLYTFDLNAPFLIKFAPGRRNRANDGFHFAAGAIVRYITTTQVITETSARGYEQRVELNDDFNINAFKVDGTVRVGYDRVKLFFNYALTPYFSKSPDIRTFAAGITVIGF